jgi:hypothetical protein
MQNDNLDEWARAAVAAMLRRALRTAAAEWLLMAGQIK